MKFQQDAAMNYVFYPYTWAIVCKQNSREGEEKKHGKNKNSLHEVHILLWSNSFRFRFLDNIVIFASE